MAALLRKSTASDFLQKTREEEPSRCFSGGCSSTELSEAEELIDVNAGNVSKEESATDLRPHL